MTVRSRHAAVALLFTGIALVAGPITMAVAQTTPAASGLGLFEATADAAGIGVSFGNPGSQPNPVAAGLVPYATAELTGGPSGRAVSSMAWPGALAANAGTLAALVGVPLPPEVLTRANYPVKAEAAASGGATDEQALGPMTAAVDGSSSAARTALSDVDAPAIVSAARVLTDSRSSLENGKVVSVAETVLQEVKIAGVIEIDSVKTIARGVSDGTTATTEHEVVVAGVTVQGQGARLDQDGLHLGAEQADNPLTPVAVGANQVLTNLGMEAFVTRPIQEEASGGNARVHTGSVVFHWNLGDGGDYFTVVLGGASVALQSAPGSEFSLGDFSGGSSGGDSFTAPPALPPATSDVAVDVALPPVEPTDAGVADIGGGSSSVGDSGGSAESFVPLDLTSAARVSDRVPFGWMLMGILGMGLVGMGLHGLRVQAIAAAAGGSTCPLERGAS